MVLGWVLGPSDRFGMGFEALGPRGWLWGGLWGPGDGFGIGFGAQGMALVVPEEGFGGPGKVGYCCTLDILARYVRARPVSLHV